MLDKSRYIDEVPAYSVTYRNHDIQFLVSILFLDNQSKPTLTPAVKKALDRIVDITGKDGLAIATISNDDAKERIVPIYLERVTKLHGAILLFCCQSPETTEHLMQFLHGHYRLRLIWDATGRAGDKT